MNLKASPAKCARTVDSVGSPMIASPSAPANENPGLDLEHIRHPNSQQTSHSTPVRNRVPMSIPPLSAGGSGISPPGDFINFVEASRLDRGKIQGMSPLLGATGSPDCAHVEGETGPDTERGCEEDAAYRRALRVVLGRVETKVSCFGAPARRPISPVPNSSL